MSKSSDHKSLDHLTILFLCTRVALDISRLYTQSNTSQNIADRLETRLLFKHDKVSSSTLVSYDANYAPRALRSREVVRGNIHILILNIFRYETHDPVAKSIHLYS